MKVQMTASVPGSPDGVSVSDYANGLIYLVPDALGTVFVNLGYATQVADNTPTTGTPDFEPQGGDDEFAEDADEAAAPNPSL